MADLDAGKLFVGGVSRDIGEYTLREYFGKYGDISSCIVAKDRVTGIPRGFGFVTLSDPSAAEKALEDQHHVIVGRKVDVKKAIPRSEQHLNLQKHYHQTLQESCGGMDKHSSYRYGCGRGDQYQFRTKKIFVGGLASNMTEEEFKNYFEKFGKISDVVVMHDNTTNRPRGFGFITYESEEVVESIVQNSFIDLGGRMVEVKRAIPKEVSRNINRGPNSRIDRGRNFDFGDLHQESFPNHYVGYGSVGGHTGQLLSPFCVMEGYCYGSFYGGGYPMSICNTMGYAMPGFSVRSPWAGFGPRPVFYPSFMNTGATIMGPTTEYNGKSDSDAAEMSNSYGGDSDQVPSNATAFKSEDKRLGTDLSSLKIQETAADTEKDRSLVRSTKLPNVAPSG